MQNPRKFDVYVTNDVEITLRIHSSKNAAVDENVSESGKQML